VDQALLARAAAVEVVAFDVDGVLTDGRLFLSDGGVQFKAFHSHDGFGLRMLMSAGIKVAAITGRESGVVTRRMAELGVEQVYQGRTDKAVALDEMLTALALEPAQAAFVGDDLVDLPAMRRVGLAIAVANAQPLVREHAHWCTTRAGGHGAVREVCELVLRATGRLDACYARWLGGV